MNLVSGIRHPYRDVGAILTNMVPSSLRDGVSIQLKGQCDPYRKVVGMDLVSSENGVAVLLFTYSLALKWLVHRALFS